SAWSVGYTATRPPPKSSTTRPVCFLAVVEAALVPPDLLPDAPVPALLAAPAVLPPPAFVVALDAVLRVVAIAIASFNYSEPVRAARSGAPSQPTATTRSATAW